VVERASDIRGRPPDSDCPLVGRVHLPLGIPGNHPREHRIERGGVDDDRRQDLTGRGKRIKADAEAPRFHRSGLDAVGQCPVRGGVVIDGHPAASVVFGRVEELAKHAQP